MHPIFSKSFKAELWIVKIKNDDIIRYLECLAEDYEILWISNDVIAEKLRQATRHISKANFDYGRLVITDLATNEEYRCTTVYLERK